MRLNWYYVRLCLGPRGRQDRRRRLTGAAGQHRRYGGASLAVCTTSLLRRSLSARYAVTSGFWVSRLQFDVALSSMKLAFSQFGLW